MNYAIKFTRAYRQDHKEIRQWYEGQRGGLGDEFELCLEQALERVRRHPFAAPEIYPKNRLLPLSRFPYNLLYRVEGDVIIALGLLHKRRDPKLWRKRIDSNGTN